MDEWGRTHGLDQRSEPVIHAVSRELQGKDKINLGSRAFPFWLDAGRVKKDLLSLTGSQMGEYLQQYEQYDRPVRNPGRFHLAGLYNQATANTQIYRQARWKETSGSGFRGMACTGREYQKKDWDSLERVLNTLDLPPNQTVPVLPGTQIGGVGNG